MHTHTHSDLAYAIALTEECGPNALLLSADPAVLTVTRLLLRRLVDLAPLRAAAEAHDRADRRHEVRCGGGWGRWRMGAVEDGGGGGWGGARGAGPGGGAGAGMRGRGWSGGWGRRV